MYFFSSVVMLHYIANTCTLEVATTKKSNSTFFFASIYFTLQSIINLFYRKLSFKSFFVSNLGTKKCEHYCSNNILLSTWTIPSFISPTKTLLLKQNEKMLQGFVLPQKKREYSFFADYFVYCQSSQYFTILFRPTFVANECFC